MDQLQTDFKLKLAKITKSYLQGQDLDLPRPPCTVSSTWEECGLKHIGCVVEWGPHPSRAFWIILPRSRKDSILAPLQGKEVVCSPIGAYSHTVELI